MYNYYNYSVNSMIKTIKVPKNDADRFIVSYETLYKNRSLNTLRTIPRRKSSKKKRQSADIVPTALNDAHV
jgi:hypothetical protein